MKKKRSVVGIILTVLGVILLVAGLWPGLAIEGPQPGFGPHQQLAVGVALVLLILGAFLCARARKPVAQQPAEQPAEEAKEEEAPQAEETEEKAEE